MDPVIAAGAPDLSEVQVDVQAVIDILAQRIAQLELTNAAQQAHIGALLAQLAIYASSTEVLSGQGVPENDPAMYPDPAEAFRQDDDGNVVPIRPVGMPEAEEQEEESPEE